MAVTTSEVKLGSSSLIPICFLDGLSIIMIFLTCQLVFHNWIISVQKMPCFRSQRAHIMKPSVAYSVQWIAARGSRACVLEPLLFRKHKQANKVRVTPYIMLRRLGKHEGHEDDCREINWDSWITWKTFKGKSRKNSCTEHVHENLILWCIFIKSIFASICLKRNYACIYIKRNYASIFLLGIMQVNVAK